MTEKPKIQNSLAAQELEKAQEQFQAFDENIKAMTLDRMNTAPILDQEPQTKLSQQEISKKKDVYIKPKRTIGSKEKFNERFREEYNFAKEYVHVIAENKEIIGELLEFWSKPFPGMPAEEWAVPCSTPVWVPRYVAEQMSRKFYHRLIMKPASIGTGSHGEYYGQMAADSTIARLTCTPVPTRRSVFMGGSNF